MYMNKESLTVAEFRKQIKMALDFCVDGGVIEIDRMGQKFLLTYVPKGVDLMIGRPGGAYTLGSNPMEVNRLKAKSKEADEVIGMYEEPIEGMRMPKIVGPKKIKSEATPLCPEHKIPKSDCKLMKHKGK